MELILLYVALAALVGAIGSSKKLGFGSAFFLSLLLSPVIGLIITLLYTSK